MVILVVREDSYGEVDGDEKLPKVSCLLSAIIRLLLATDMVKYFAR